MSDYAQINDYSAKDALATGNPLKIIAGSDIDGELDAISTAIATKFDTTSIASAGEAQAGISNTVVMTPGRTTTWAQNNAGAVADIQNLADPGADNILFWDNSDTAIEWLTLGAGLAITANELAIVTAAGGAASADRTLTAGTGLSGGGDLTADRTFNLDLTSLAAATLAAGDEVVFADVSDSNTPKKIAFSAFEATLNLANQVAPVLTAGSGLSYSVGGTAVNVTSTIDLDISSLTEETTVDFTADAIAFRDTSAGADRKISPDDLFGAALGDARYYLSSNQAISAGVQTKMSLTGSTYDELQRGTFASSTYTRGAVGGRVLVTAKFRVLSMNDDDSIRILIYQNGAEVSRVQFYNDTDSDTPVQSIQITDIVNCAASDTIEIYAYTSSAETLVGASKDSNACFVELS